MPARPASPFGPTPVPTLEEIAAIVAAGSNPSLRNLRITECYGRLSRALAGATGPRNLNWCSFGTWASRTAGRFIRLADVDAIIREAVRDALGPVGALAGIRRALRHLPGGHDFVVGRVVEAVKELATETSAEVAAGNLTVFAELAPLFSALGLAMTTRSDQGAVPARVLIDALRPGPTSQGGQELLRQAVADYWAARTAPNGSREAELMLRANARVGAHEQMRLQPYIHRAMTTSLADRVEARVDHVLRTTMSESMGRRLSALLEARLRPYRSALEEIWLRIATRYLMTLELPRGTLWLGRDLPSPPGQPLSPAELADLHDDELLQLFRTYRADGDSVRGSGAVNWSDLSARMRYILELFRSRQQDASLFEPPFDASVTAAIARGTVPLLGI